MPRTPSKAASTSSGDNITTVTASTHVSLPLNPSHPSDAELNPKSHADEFMGPIGALGVTVTTPLIAYLLFYGCKEGSGCPPRPEYWDLSGESFGKVLNRDVLDVKAWAVYGAWYAFTVACWYLLPGDWVEGTLLRDGTRRLYKINGELAGAVIVDAFG